MPDCNESVAIWQRKANRERAGRLAAEVLIELKSREFYDNECIIAAASTEVDERIRELECAKKKAEASSVAKTQFLAHLSHEIRTPLTGSVGTLELLRDTELNTHQSELVDTVIRCSDSLLDFINSVLDASKLDVGRVTLVSEPCDMPKLVSDSVDLFRAAATNKRLELNVAFNPDQETWIQGDSLRLRQIINNLIGNAVKFTIEGHVDVLLSQYALGAGHVALTLQVSDTGLGILPEDQERIFSEFEQVHSSSVRQIGGSGLGLSIARRLARLMGGDITLLSELGKGSTFTLALLAQQVECPEEESAFATENALEGLNVLVVDDNAQNRLVTARMLSHMGCRVALAESGPVAMEHLQSRDFDLVLLDGQMPVMTGDQMARLVRDPRSSVRRHDVPILCVTADVIADRLAGYLAAGMDGVLTKPFRKSELWHAIREVMTRPRC